VVAQAERTEAYEGPGEDATRPRRRFGDNSVTLSIATAAGIASFAMNFWWPFMPIYLQELGATDESNALFWVAAAMTGTGFARLASGPLWGILSDRLGRKMMFIRALYAATLTTFIAAFATEPWHIVVALTSQGLFSGFIPAAVALTSVSVPNSRLRSALGTVTGAQFIGTTAGPAVGAGLAIALGFRGAIFAAALMPAIAATAVILMVPRDTVEKRPKQVRVPGAKRSRPSLAATLRGLSPQLYLAILLFFTMFALNQLVRIATPIAIADLTGTEESTGASGIAFTVAGLAGVIGALGVARFVRAGTLRRSLTALCVVSAVGHLLLALTDSELVYMAWFGLISLAHGAMLPGTNTLIAASVSPQRRGTAFGFASSAQALAFMAGPTGAAVMSTVSFAGGFVLVGLLFLALGLLLFVAMREPDLEDAPA